MRITATDVIPNQPSRLAPRRSLFIRCPREVWERVGEYLSVTSQLKVESRNDRAENTWGLGWFLPVLEATGMLTRELVVPVFSLHADLF